MRTLLFTSFLIAGLAGSGLAKTGGMSHTAPVNDKFVKLIADLPSPNPTSKKCPLRADLPSPNPTSKKCPVRAA